MRRLSTSAAFAFATLTACSGGGGSPPVPPSSAFPVGTTRVAPRTVDRASTASCSVATDGIAYTLPADVFAPIDFTTATCSAATALDAAAVPPVPTWAAPPASTKALFVASSLQESYVPSGMTLIEADATASRLPVTWMVGDPRYLDDAGLARYDAFHRANGDDVEVEEATGLGATASRLPWYGPSVSVEGAGRERMIANLRALGDTAFWGITWNSHGTDGTSDEGAPWGAYCADPSSYKRPAPDGSCDLLSFEWTARDLTRAFFEDTNLLGYSSEAAFSTDPDDVLDRGGFAPANAQTYVRGLVDAYAAAGETSPIVMMSQQETADEGSYANDDPVLAALYDEAAHDGFVPATLPRRTRPHGRSPRHRARSPSRICPVARKGRSTARRSRRRRSTTTTRSPA